MDYYVIFSTLFFYYTKIFSFFYDFIISNPIHNFLVLQLYPPLSLLSFFLQGQKKIDYFFIYLKFPLISSFIRFSQFLFLIQFKTNLISKFGLNTVKNFTHLISFSQTPLFLFLIWESTFFLRIIWKVWKIELEKTQILKKIPVSKKKFFSNPIFFTIYH